MRTVCVLAGFVAPNLVSLRFAVACLLSLPAVVGEEFQSWRLVTL